MMDDRSLQTWLKSKGHYAGAIDGDFGPKSHAAARAVLIDSGIAAQTWDMARAKIGAAQLMLKEAGFSPGAIDGYRGHLTDYALGGWLDAMRDVTLPDAAIVHQPTVFPRQRDMLAFYGPPGTGHESLSLPYPMRIAWNKAQVVNRVTTHAKCADAFGAALANAKSRYGYERLRALGLDLFGGCFNNRPMRGGTSLSTHAYACAWDINPEANQLHWGRDRAAMAKPDCAAFIDCFYEQGIINLGRERNMDFMHFQAARL